MSEVKQLDKPEPHIPADYDPELFRIRHSSAHIMAQAVLERYPGAKIAIGPPVSDGFYYDFELPEQPSPEVLTAIEERMREIIKGRHDFKAREVSGEEARELFKDQPYKMALIEGLLSGKEDEHGNEIVGDKPALWVYQHDKFTDLCQGPHVDNTSQINPKAVKIMKLAGAYWRGDHRNPMLTRIYGTAWKSKDELADYERRLEDARKRDHRKLGKELELFANSDLLGSGLPLWLPKGATIRQLLEDYIRFEERKHGYQHVFSPHLAKVDLYKTSGHWAHYKDMMFPPMELENETVVLRPMNCPHHILIYDQKPHSYRDLPVRIAELATMYRYEMSGVVGGLSRVRAMTLNDAHIFCTPDQVKAEFSTVVSMVERAYKMLGITDYSYRLSLRDKNDKEKYVDNDEMWDRGETMLREAMNALGVPYREAKGEAAFYGPKLDIQIRDVHGREETMSTIQVDFHLPSQFNLHYIGEDGKELRPVMIHRGVISTMERMTAYLIELYAGAFPVWLAPVQATLIPVADRHNDYARKVGERLIDAGFRVEMDLSDKRMNYKIRVGQQQKIPFLLVVGDREVENEMVSVRLRTNEDRGGMPVADFEALLRRLTTERSLGLD